MKLKNPWLLKTAGLGIAGLVRGWMASLEYKAELYEPRVDPVHPEWLGPAIYLFWHEYIPFPFYLRGYCNISMLLSQHQDAEFLSQAARYMGFETIRGSTNRGGVAALRELLRVGGERNLAITPDGPRGPRRRLAQGAIYLSSRLEMPLVLMGLGYDRPWRYQRAWDQFAIPRPWSRARAVVSPPLRMPPDLDRAGVEHHRQRVERLLNRLTESAERWACAGTARPGETLVRRQAAPARPRLAGPHPTGSQVAPAPGGARDHQPMPGPPSSAAETGSSDQPVTRDERPAYRRVS